MIARIRIFAAVGALYSLFISVSFAAEPGHWAFVRPKRPEIPSARDRSWVRNPIDAFILAKLDAQSLRPSPTAGRAVLLRRLSFDLTGLPPTPEELDGFLADSSPEAYERVVERLLASPHFGERSGQHWLDLARFAESDGFEFDQVRPDAWRYRDWVIQALNRDLPYDAFVRLQLAGDEVQPGEPSAFIATGFNRCYPDMVDLNDQGLRRQNALSDITETTGLVFLGLTLGCARCHDHKFDPIRQSDFYAMQAFFTPARFRDDYPLASFRESLDHERRLNAWKQEVTRLKAALIDLESRGRAMLAPGMPAGLNDEAAAAFAKPAAERSPREVELVFDSLARDRRVDPRAWMTVLDPPALLTRRAWMARLDGLLRSRPAELPKARGIDEAGPGSPPTYVLRRGEYTAKGPEVVPAFPSVLCSSDQEAVARPRASLQSTGRRTALADWLVRPDHPLTARVMVNRLWQQHFGRGLVGTTSDFGAMGDEPSHPELLDWLATEFVARGWSMKAMHRLIVSSATYRQSSRADDQRDWTADPDNTLLWKQNRRRLDGEAIRDALLIVAGRLNRGIGGPSVFPELPPELKRLSSKGAVWPVSPKVEDRERRSLYVFVRRNLRFPFFEVFDRPDTNASCPRRPVTTIAPQALSLLNSPLAHDMARALAARVEREAGSRANSQVMHVSRIVFGQAPDDAERQLMTEFLDGGGSLEHLCLALLNTNAFVYID